MLRSNANEVFDNIQKVIVSLKPDEKLLKEITISIVGQNKRRVHNDGVNPDNKKLGDYSRKRIYVSPKSSPKSLGTLSGKSGESTFSNGNSHKSKFFKDGYKGFRSSIGRRSDTVDLSLFGDLERGFTWEQLGDKFVAGIVNSQVEKYNGLEKKYGEIYGIGKEDQVIINQIIKKRLSQLTK